MGARDGRTSVEDAQRVIAAALEARRDEIEGKLRRFLETDERTANVLDVEYTEGLRACIPKAIDYALAGISGEGRSKPDVPAVLLIQARVAARNGVSFAVVQRRYMHCFHLYAGCLLKEAEEHRVDTMGALHCLRRAKALFDDLLDAIEDEYERERARPSTREQRHAGLVRERLAGRYVDDSALDYEFNNCHVALIARGVGASGAIRAISKELDCLSLIVQIDERVVWAWLGKRGAPDLDKLQRLVSLHWPADTPLGIGEVGRGDEGWRRTYHQARSAFRLALRTPAKVFRYGNDPLLMALTENDELAEWLRETFLAPLKAEKDGGLKSLRTLRAYLAADRNARSAAAALKVAPQTVANHLQTVERLIGRPLSDCAMEIDLALRLEELEAPGRREVE
jgi:hypothetical protein